MFEKYGFDICNFDINFDTYGNNIFFLFKYF